MYNKRSQGPRLAQLLKHKNRLSFEVYVGAPFILAPLLISETQLPMHEKILFSRLFELGIVIYAIYTL